MLEFLNEISGLLTIGGLLFVISFFFLSIRWSLKLWHDEHEAHCQEARVIKDNTWQIRNWLEKQEIHQKYMLRISEDSVKAVQDMNNVLSRLSNILESIEKKIDKWDNR